jgi:hypothetical protein
LHPDVDNGNMYKVKTHVKIIGINPFILLPDNVLNGLFKKNGKDKGPIPVRGTINNRPYQQTLVKYNGKWRLYVNTQMLKNSPKRIGETIEVSIEYDPSDRSIAPHPKLIEVLNTNLMAKERFELLTPSLQKEIIKYISLLKSEKSVERNVDRAISFLLGKERFIGRPPLN